MRSLCLLCLLSVWVDAVHADACVSRQGQTGFGLGVYFDQDMFVPGANQDRDYTMGIGVEFFQDDGPLYLLGDLLERVEPLVGFDRRCGRIYQSYLLGSINYTPDDIGNPQPIYDDRPYASLLYLANKKVVADDDRAVGVELVVGALGLNIARDVQRALHGWYRDQADETEPVDPEGWSYQISDGGELTARVRLSDTQRIAHAAWWDVARSWDVNLGFQTNASIGVSGRIGQLKSPFWSMPYDPINRGNFVPALGGRELYVWGALRARAVAYDALLQGQFSDSEVTVDYDDMRKLLWEAGVGVTKSWPRFQLTFSVNAKAGDTRLPGAPDSHVWGGLYFSQRYD